MHQDIEYFLSVITIIIYMQVVRLSLNEYGEMDSDDLERKLKVQL